MTALNDAERAAIRRDAEGGARTGASEQVEAHRGRAKTGRYPAWLPSRRFIAAVIAIGGMQLLATMDSTVAIVALPKIQDELSLSDAGRSWVITAYVLTFGGLMLLGGRLGDTIGRKRTFIVGVALFTIASILCGRRLGREHAGHRPAAAGRRRGDRVADRSGADRHHVPQGPGPQRRHGGVRRDDRRRLGDGPDRRRRADRGVLAAGRSWSTCRSGC